MVQKHVTSTTNSNHFQKDEHCSLCYLKSDPNCTLDRKPPSNRVNNSVSAKAVEFAQKMTALSHNFMDLFFFFFYL